MILRKFVNLNRNPRLRQAMLTSLCALDRSLHRLSEDFARPRVQILMLHDLSEADEEPFRAILDRLAVQHRFVSYSDAIDRIVTNKIDAPYIAFSFDDGLESCLRAAQILKDYSISACFFVCPSIVGEKDPATLARFSHDRLHEEAVYKFLSWTDLEALQKGGHEIGGHSSTHANLAKVSEAQLEAETGGCYESLQRRLGPIAHFCWPFGHFTHMTGQAVQAVFNAGFQSCASAERGCHVTQAANPHALCVRRDQIVPAWPMSHIEFFLARNSRTAVASTNQWPAQWAPSFKEAF